MLCWLEIQYTYVIFSFVVSFIIPLKIPTVVFSHCWIPVSLTVLFHYAYSLLEPFALLITNCAQVIMSKVQM
jgi:hypothetical protein